MRTKRTESLEIWEVIKVEWQIITADADKCEFKTLRVPTQANAIKMYREGVNPIEVLLWSRDKCLREVQERVGVLTRQKIRLAEDPKVFY